METPLEIAWRDMEPNSRAEDEIRERAAKLENYFDRITSCRVVVEAPHKRHRNGNAYHVGCTLTVPGRTLVVARERNDAQKQRAHQNLHVAIRDTFDAITRQLQDYARQLQGQIKHHEPQPEGKVRLLFPTEDYGFIEGSDGRDVYFHRNSVVDGDFDELEVGSRVRFSEEQGVEGPQASTVHLVETARD